MIVKKAFHSQYFEGSCRELHAAVWGNVLQDRRQIYTACHTHYKPVSHGDSKLWVCTRQVLFCLLLQKDSPSTHPLQRNWVTVVGEDQQPKLKEMTTTSLLPYILAKVSGHGDQRRTEMIGAVKVCPQTKEKEGYETTILEFKRGRMNGL